MLVVVEHIFERATKGSHQLKSMPTDQTSNEEILFPNVTEVLFSSPLPLDNLLGKYHVSCLP